MNKGVIIAIVIVLLLCAIVAVGGGAAWYFLFRQSPENAYAKAQEKFNSDDSVYHFTSDVDMSFEVRFPEYPSFNQTFEMTMSGEGDEDINAGKSYYKSTTVMDGDKELVEVYIIGDDTYTKVGTGEFTKTTSVGEEENADFSESVFTRLTEDYEYELLDEEEINGVACYHYKLVMTDDLLQDFSDEMSGSFQEGLGDDLQMSDFAVTNAYFELWISKSGSDLIRSVLTVEEMVSTGETEGVTMEVVLMDMVVTTEYSKWGEAVEIEAPI